MEHFFVLLTGADDSRLRNYKIRKFTVLVRSWGEGGGGGGGGEVLNLSFERSRGGGGY